MLGHCDRLTDHVDRWGTRKHKLGSRFIALTNVALTNPYWRNRVGNIARAFPCPLLIYTFAVIIVAVLFDSETMHVTN